MKKILIALTSAAVGTASYASTFSFTPTGNTDLSDLSHDSAYVWGITGTGNNNNTGSGSETALKNQLSNGYHITSATITITGIYNWDPKDTSNQLFIELLDNPKTGIKTVIDDAADQGVNQGTVSNYFAGKISSNHGIYYTGTDLYLTQYHDPLGGSNHAINYSFNFTASELQTLAGYINDGHTSGTADFGLGFDPDCHFFNTGVTFTVCTAKNVTPDAGVTLGLASFGLLALAAFRRFLRS